MKWQIEPVEFDRIAYTLLANLHQTAKQDTADYQDTRQLALSTIDVLLTIHDAQGIDSQLDIMSALAYEYNQLPDDDKQ